MRATVKTATTAALLAGCAVTLTACAPVFHGNAIAIDTNTYTEIWSNRGGPYEVSFYEVYACPEELDELPESIDDHKEDSGCFAAKINKTDYGVIEPGDVLVYDQGLIDTILKTS
jgi:hypothetical protein